ncbi:protein phosphatase inhibitor 2-like [Cotesia glomerata]|uniref:Protein phosphatase inhibitor 2 n=1 Tax=Cotesia glomerata TaxID=32391 RepID=A0AAV7J9X1_COTGL|nr:protein phosphatase inhibitor 2-like [Cotesia glomerata]KAH0568512.1 hypothetical protein KQX54_021112 [Cotesia glomerata]
MAENLGKRPSKGILKTSSSFESHEAPPKPKKQTNWDEMNVLATLHPPEKDYGHMKIEEPKTPYNYEGYGNSHEDDELDSSAVSEKLSRNSQPRIFQQLDDEEEDELDTPEKIEKRKAFLAKRKGHYREWDAVTLARSKQLLEEDEDEDEDEENKDNNDPHNSDQEDHPVADDNESEPSADSNTATKCVSLSCDSENKSELNSPE